MRIAQVNSFYAPALVGGTEVVVQALAGGLAARGHAVEVFCTAVRPADDCVDGIPVHRRANHNLYWTPAAGSPSAPRRALWQLRDLHNRAAASDVVRALVAFRPDLVHLHQIGGLSPALYGRIRSDLAGVAIVQTLHDFWHACVRQTLVDGRGRTCDGPHGLCALRSRVTLGAARVVDRFVSPSHFLAGWYADRGLIARDRIEVIPNGIDPPTEAPAPGARPAAPPLRVLYLGQLLAHKGVGTLLRAAERLDPDAIAIEIAGAGPMEDEVRACRHVRFLGRVTGEAKRAALHRAHVLVEPSECSENAPLAVLEAFQAGLAVVASAIGGMPELVHPDVNGLLHRHGDAEALAAALESCASEPDRLARWQAGARGRALELTMSSTVGRYLALYARLAAR